MQQFLRDRIDPKAIRGSLKTVDNRNVNCVDIDKQPAMKRPDMLGHKVQLAPASVQQNLASSGGSTMPRPLDASATTLLNPNGTWAQCPPMPVPIVEITMDELLRFRNLAQYFKKVPDHISNTGVTAEPPSHQGPTSTHQYAWVTRNVTNWGAASTINIWAPYTELNSEFSLSQIWVTRGSGTGLQSLEVGVQKYHDLYSDDAAHLFIYSTQDSYQTTGCYNNTCGDFVQVSSSWIPGQALTSSLHGGAQHEESVYWMKDYDNGSWWLHAGDEWVGYYPRELYNAAGVQNHAATISFGGEIIDNRNLNLHTSTDMGSGVFPSLGYADADYGYVAYQRSLGYVWQVSNGYFYFANATGLTTSRTDALCYDISYQGSDPNAPDWGPYFFFGGAGYSSNCY